MIRSDASAARITQAVVQAQVRALAHGGAVAAAAAARLAVPAAALAAAQSARATAAEAHQSATAAWLVARKSALGTLGVVRDLIWNALGRPAHHEALSALFPSGLATYTRVPRASLPLMLQLLVARLTTLPAPPWTPTQRATWSAELESARAPLAAATESARLAAATHKLAAATQAACVRRALRALVALKRDLHSLELTEVQIHEIIPDATPRGTGSAPSTS